MSSRATKKNARPVRRRSTQPTSRAPQKRSAPVVNPRRQSRNQPPRSRAVQFSACAIDYFHSVANPFEGAIGCVPSELPSMSRKTRFICRGVGKTNTVGIGWVCADPLNALVSDLTIPAVVSSSGVGSDTTFNFTTPANINLGISNSEFNTTQFGPGAPDAQGRIVGAALRLKYNGTMLNAGGTIHALVDPNHDSLANRNFTSIDAELATRWFPFTHENNVILHYSPKTPEELDFIAPPFFTASAVGTNTNRFYMGAMIQSALNSQPFEYEFYVTAELQGRNINGKTPTSSDPVALAAANTVMSNIYPSTSAPTTVESNLVNSAVNFVKSGVSAAVDIANTAKAGYNAYKDITSSMSRLSVRPPLTLK